MKLLIDAGNSSLKWTLWSDTGCGPVSRLKHDAGRIDAQLFQRHLSGLKGIEGITVSNVAGDGLAEELSAATRKIWGMEPVFAASQKSALGLTIAYDRPELLGVDRWLAMVAAYNATKASVLVVDCGTAVTLDAVDQTGRHLGGLIAPGRELMWSSLFRNTRIPAVPQRSFEGILGTDTAECIAAGVLHSTTGLIERLYRQLPPTFGENRRLILTGGDADTVAGQLGVAAEIRHQLIFEGLALL